MGLERCAIRDVVGNLAHPVHVVGEAQQLGLDLVPGEHPEGVPNHRCARHLAEGADMRQAGRPVAGLEQDGLGEVLVLVAGNDLLGFLERPCLAFGGGREHLGIEIDDV